MITPKIKALFQFIEFLYSNIENFKSNDELIKELELLDIERQKVNSKKTFNDKLKYDEVQAEIETKFKILQDNTANQIKAKAIELNVCNFDKEPIYNWFGIDTDIRELKENFSKSDLPEIFEHKRKYIEYRNNTHKSFLSLSFFFNDLDEILKELFGYFNETEKNEFETFETKTIQVKDLGEAVELLRTGKMSIEQKIYYYQTTKWNIPFRELYHTVVTVCDFVKPIFPNIEPLKYIDFFLNEIDFDKIEMNENKEETIQYCNSIYFGLEQLLKADIDNAILEYQRNISILNKEQIKETQIKLIELIGNLKRQARTVKTGISFTQRYNELYDTIKAKKWLISIDYQIIISHFNETIINDLLSSFEIITSTFKEITPFIDSGITGKNKTQNAELFNEPNLLSSPDNSEKMHPHIFKGNAFEVWQSMFDSFQITESSRTDVKFMFEEMKKDNLIHNTVNQTTFLKWISDTYQITIEKTSNHSKTAERISIYSNAKQLYKV